MRLPALALLALLLALLLAPLASAAVLAPQTVFRQPFVGYGTATYSDPLITCRRDALEVVIAPLPTPPDAHLLTFLEGPPSGDGRLDCNSPQQDALVVHGGIWSGYSGSNGCTTVSVGSPGPSTTVTIAFQCGLPASIAGVVSFSPL